MSLDEAILKLIAEEGIGDQTHLAARLAAAGYPLTQPTLSRHLKRLNIRKVHGIYRHVEHSPVVLPEYEIREAPPNLLVLKTRPGHAQLIAVHLDAQRIEGVIGTVAGDDTVFIAATGRLAEVAERLSQTLAELGQA